MFGNNHQVVISHPYDLAMEWRVVQEKKRQAWETHLLRFGKDIIPCEPAWHIHDDQDMLNEHDAKVMALEIFKGTTISRTINSLQTLFPDLDIGASRLDVFNCQASCLHLLILFNVLVVSCIELSRNILNIFF